MPGEPGKKLKAIARRLAGADDGAEAAAALAALGVPERARGSFLAPPAQAWVYPENWWALELAVAMASQWRVGWAGAVGLDYNALPVVEARIGLPETERADAFAALRIIEAEMLAVWREDAARQA